MVIAQNTTKVPSGSLCVLSAYAVFINLQA